VPASELLPARRVRLCGGNRATSWRTARRVAVRAEAVAGRHGAVARRVQARVGEALVAGARGGPPRRPERTTCRCGVFHQQYIKSAYCCTEHHCAAVQVATWRALNVSNSAAFCEIWPPTLVLRRGHSLLCQFKNRTRAQSALFARTTMCIQSQKSRPISMLKTRISQNFNFSFPGSTNRSKGLP